MTTRIKITNEGQEPAAVWAYDQQRQFKPHADVLEPGESLTVEVWDGHLPVVMPGRQVPNSGKFFRCPPATMAG